MNVKLGPTGKSQTHDEHSFHVCYHGGHATSSKLRTKINLLSVFNVVSRYPQDCPTLDLVVEMSSLCCSTKMRDCTET